VERGVELAATLPLRPANDGDQVGGQRQGVGRERQTPGHDHFAVHTVD
jgi:hypothetical protein